MLDQLLPARLDNAYRGHKIALFLLIALVAIKVVMGVNSIFNGYTVASSADGIPLDAFPSAAAQTVVTLFSLLGLSHLISGLLGMLVLLRYRSAIPFMFALILLEHVSGQVILAVMPIATTGTSPASAINLGLFALELTGLGLSVPQGHRSTVA